VSVHKAEEIKRTQLFDTVQLLELMGGNASIQWLCTRHL